MKDRNIGIDFLKFFAVLFITNSHMQLLYGDYRALAIGGTLGNVLFFFCSGFTLFLKPFERAADFPNWYKRRINRIYPSVLALAIVSCTFFNTHHDINFIILHGGRWFVTGIMVFYVFLYFIGVYLRDKLNWVMLALIAVGSVWFFASGMPSGMFGNEHYQVRWTYYFLFMLFGAMVGMRSLNPSEGKTMNQWWHLSLSLLSVIVFFALNGLTARYQGMNFIQVITFIPLMSFMYFLYKWGEGSFARSIYNNKTGHFIVRFVGGLCLEVYLIQNLLFSDKLNFLFPLNLLIFFVVILIAAYLLRCLARLIGQTFKDAPYDWKKMVDVY